MPPHVLPHNPCRRPRLRVLALLCLLAPIGCDANAQRGASTRALPECEWCGAPEAPAELASSVSLHDAREPGPPLVVTGVVYYSDTRTPAGDVLLYVYHTNTHGVYPRQSEQPGNGQRHGALRGWLRTDSLGRYRISTIKPGSYQSDDEPAHIHITVTPPGGTEDWIDVIVFDDDPLLTPDARARLRNRGGSGIVVLTKSADTLRATRDIMLSVAPPAATERRRDTLAIDRERSQLAWRGTKFRGRSGHEGTVAIASGQLHRCNNAICGGSFAIDMTRIEVTDIPVDQPVPRGNLTRHLHSDDFFATARYPEARFVITAVRPAGTNEGAEYVVTGNLSVRDSTRSIRFPASASPCGDATCVSARFSLDRRQWGITYRFDPIRNEIIDDLMEIRLQLVVPHVISGTT